MRQNAATESELGRRAHITPEAGDLNDDHQHRQEPAPAAGAGRLDDGVQADFSVTPHAATQQGGIIAYQDDNDYLKLDWEFSTGAARLSETIEDSLSGTPVVQVLTTIPTAPVFGTATTVWLRMVKTGPRYSTYYSTNGTDFTALYTTGAALTNVKVGLFAFNRAGTSTDLHVAFDDFQVKNDRPRHHRW